MKKATSLGSVGRNTLRATALLAALGAAAIPATSSAVPMVSWSISGPGTTAATQVAANEWDLSYNLNPAGFSTVSWDVSAIAGSAGDYEFDWDYTGFHAFFRVTAFLQTSTGTTLYSAGPQNCCTSPSGGFSQSGNFTFSGVSAGDTIGFTMGGSNFDSNNVLRGTLNLVQAPEPATLALLGLGLVGIGYSRRRATRH